MGRKHNRSGGGSPPVWSDRAIVGAIAHDAGQFDKHLYHFKFDFLQKQAARLNYDYFVWLDADNFFVRHPGEVLSVLGGDATANPGGVKDSSRGSESAETPG